MTEFLTGAWAFVIIGGPILMAIVLAIWSIRRRRARPRSTVEVARRKNIERERQPDTDRPDTERPGSKVRR